MSTEREIPSEQLSSSPQEASTHNSNNQTAFPTQYYSYYPMPYNYMGYVQPSYPYQQTLYNTGYTPQQYFPYHQTMYNHMTYALQFPHYQLVHDYTRYVQPQFTSPPVYVNTATEPQPSSQYPLPQPEESPPSTASMPTRALLLKVIPTFITEATLRHELEAFGDIRAIQVERLDEGFVTVHFYDMRDAHNVLVAVHHRNMQQTWAVHGVISERVTWAAYTLPDPSAFPDGDNQGTIVVFNLDSRVSSNDLKEIFEEFGPVKEVRETPNKIQQKFIEFYDVRDAARAKEQMKGKKIYNKKVGIEYGIPGGDNKNQEGASSLRLNRSAGRLPPRNLPPRLRRLPPTSSVECKLSGKVSLWKDPPDGEYNGNASGSNSSDQSPTTNLSFSGQLECSSITLNEDQNVISTRLTRIRNNPRFKIDVDGPTDLRTTVMIRNIPNKFTRRELMTILDNLCIEINEQMEVIAGEEQPASYDYVYLPIDFTEEANMGYAFVNMTSPKAAINLYKAFHRQTWPDAFKSTKTCEVSYARIQGIEAIKDHLKHSKLPFDLENMPVMFSPPRDGQTLTDPHPIFYPDSSLQPLRQHPVSPPAAATSKEDQLDVPPAEAAEDGDDETGSDKNDDGDENYFLRMHGVA